MPQIEIAVIVMKDAVNVLVVKPKEGPDAGKWIIPTGVVNEGEKLIEAADRLLREQVGLSTVPKRILFPVEMVEQDYPHRIVLVGFSECASSGEPKPSDSLADARFIDPRKLGDYQNEGMSVITARAFSNFSAILIAQAQAAALAASKSGVV